MLFPVFPAVPRLRSTCLSAYSHQQGKRLGRKTSNHLSASRPHLLWEENSNTSSSSRRRQIVPKSSAPEDARAPSSESIIGVSTYRTWSNGGGLVHETADVHPSAVVHPGAVVCDGARIGEDCEVGCNTCVGTSVEISQGTRIHFNVSLQNCKVGKGCVIHNGVCIGQDGFGFYVDEKTGEMVKKPQDLGVEIGDYVEIGANTCVDRGSWRNTQIGSHTKLDNLCQVGHNAVVGEKCMLCGHVALGGSSTLGNFVVMGGKAAVRDHVEVCDYVRIAAKSGVTKDIKQKGDYAGFPAQSSKAWKEQIVVSRMLTRQMKLAKFRDAS